MKNKLKAVTIILRASKSLEKLLKSDISSYGLNTTEFGVLEFLYHRGPQPMSNLCKKLLMANSSMTYVVDNLVKNNYVDKYNDSEDKRSNFVALTEEGEKYIESIFPTHENRISEVFSVLSEEEQESMMESLKKVGILAETIATNKEGK
ncbi:MAG: MarR family transcriptional regulator [Bacilli bacterium]|nr:MarR family transcriptional regulator [Bacilli bacterium]